MNGVVGIDSSNIKKRIRKRKRRLKFFLFLIMISLLAIFLLTVPVFKVNEIVVSGNNLVSTERIAILTGVKSGDNLLKLNMGRIEENVLTNPYIETCKATRSLFGKLYIAVSERQSAGLTFFGDKYVTIDKNGVIIDIADSIDELDLPLISGLKIKNAVPGKPIELTDYRQLDTLKEIFGVITSTDFSGIINEVDISSLVSIKLKTKYDVTIKVGSIDNIKDKLVVAKTIIEQDINVKGLKGTLDVSFNGNPVFSQD